MWQVVNDYFFDKRCTNVIKGIMLVFMFVLHFWCYPEWYIDSISYPDMSFMTNYIGNFQICIAGFSFLTGYFYFYTREKTYKYSLKKIYGLYLPYWIVLLIFLSIALILGTFEFDIMTLILEVLALSGHLVSFGWYVVFYMLMMLVFPLVSKIAKKSYVLFLAICIFVPIGLYYVIQRIFPEFVFIGTIEKFQVYFPIAAIGFACAGNNVFQLIDRLLSNKILRVIICIISAAVVFMEPTWLYHIGSDNLVMQVARKLIRMFSIPLFIYSLVTIIKMINAKILLPLELIGKYSMLMWFLHGIFFNCSKEIFQPVLYLPKNPVLVTLWGLMLCVIIAIPLDLLVELILKKTKA